MKLKFVCDVEKCSACAACAIACMDQNDIDVQSSAVGAMRRCVIVREDNRDGRVVYTSMSCVHCKDAPCVVGCPTGCLYKDPETGLTLYDKEKCVGCHRCVIACPSGAPCFDPDGKINKCDGCYGRKLSGLERACVRACPVGALECVWVSDNEPDAEFIT